MAEPTEPAEELCTVGESTDESCGHPRTGHYGVKLGKKYKRGHALSVTLCACGCLVMTTPGNESKGAECKTCRDSREANPLHYIPPPRNHGLERNARNFIVVFVLIIMVWMGLTIGWSPGRPHNDPQELS